MGAKGRDISSSSLVYNPSQPGFTRVAFAVHLFPFIEEGTRHADYDFSRTYHSMTNDPNSPFAVSQPAFTCPSDEPVRTTNCDGRTARDFKGNYGVNWGPWSYDCQRVELRATRDGVVPSRGCSSDSSVAVQEHGAPFHIEWGAKISQITDGTSHTLAMMEMVQIPELGSVCDRRGRIWNDDFGCYQINTRATPNSSDTDFSWCDTQNVEFPCQQQNNVKQGRLVSRSRHPGGVVALLCDASVHFVSDSIDLIVWQAASTIDGGEVSNLTE